MDGRARGWNRAGGYTLAVLLLFLFEHTEPRLQACFVMGCISSFDLRVPGLVRGCGLVVFYGRGQGTTRLEKERKEERKAKGKCP